MALFVLRKLILQTRMRSHPVGLDVWFLVGPFVYFHTSFVRTAKALARAFACRLCNKYHNLIGWLILWVTRQKRVTTQYLSGSMQQLYPPIIHCNQLYPHVLEQYQLLFVTSYKILGPQPTCSWLWWAERQLRPEKWIVQFMSTSI